MYMHFWRRPSFARPTHFISNKTRGPIQIARKRGLQCTSCSRQPAVRGVNIGTESTQHVDALYKHSLRRLGREYFTAVTASAISELTIQLAARRQVQQPKMMSSEEYEVLYEVLYTLRSELAKKRINPGVFDAPWKLGSGVAALGVLRVLGLGALALHISAREDTVGQAPLAQAAVKDGKDITPAEMGVLMKYGEEGRQRAAIGGILGASAMAGVWKVTALGGFLGVAGVIMGGAIGARAAQAREIIREKLPHNSFAQELLKSDK